MIAILSYLVLALFLGGSLYILGLMFYLVIKKGETRVKPIDRSVKFQADFRIIAL